MSSIACPHCGVENSEFVSRCAKCGAALPLSSRAQAAADASQVDSSGHERSQRVPWVADYRILAKLGEGGMGVVYEAEQQHPRRRVALKVIRGGRLVDNHRVKLFQREAEALARLKHPGIASIYEAGCTEDGQHFFAMELVAGETLAAYVERRRAEAGTRLEAREVLALFLNIAGAISYAHQRAVIHRDLKPSNILVTIPAAPSAPGRGEPVPEVKVLDFGLARITDTDVTASTIMTEAGQIRGTLAYMSPEQVRGNPDEIDLRSDIYSLGVILHELLTGVLPYDIPSGPLHEAVRVICEQSPRPLRRAQARPTDRTRPLDRDLETIVGKALEKEPARRYQSVSDFAGDLERYLGDQPILARPASTAYQLRKLIARHKLPFVFLAAILVLLSTFTAATAVQSRRLARERDRALAAENRAMAEAETARRTADFMVGIFEVSDPSEARGNAVTAREVLDRGAKRIEGEMKDQPAVQATLMAALGRVYRSLGLYGTAEPLLRKSLDLKRRSFGPDSLEAAESLCSLAESVGRIGTVFDGDRRSAGSLARECLQIRRKILGNDDLAVAEGASLLGTVLHWSGGEGAEAEALFREALAIRQRHLGRDNVLVASTLGELGSLLSWGRRDLSGGEPLLTEALAIRRRLLPRDHPDVLDSLQALANHYSRKGDWDAAERFYAEALAAKRRVYGENHWRVAGTLSELAWVASRRCTPQQAQAVATEALRIAQQAGPEAGSLAETLTINVAEFKRQAGSDLAARPFLRAALAACRASNSPRLPYALYNLGSVLSLTGERAEAEATYREALSIARHALSDHPLIPQLLFGLAEFLGRESNGERRQLYAEAAAGQHALLAKLRKVRDPESRSHPRSEAEVVLGGCLRGLGRFEEAEPLLLRAYADLQRSYCEGDYRTRSALVQIVELYQEWGKPAKSAQYRGLLAGPPKSAQLSKPISH
jgi:serine/threonine protein kinase